MIFTKDEIQERINRSSDTDIQELIEDGDFINEVCTPRHDEYSLNKKFVQKFFYDNLENVVNNLKGYMNPIRRVIIQLNAIANTLDYSESDWDNHVNCAIKMNKLNDYKSFSYTMIAAEKNANYLKYIIKNSDKIKSNIAENEPIASFLRKGIDTNLINSLLQDEKADLLSVMTELKGQILIFFEDDSVVHDFVTDVKDIEKFIADHGLNYSRAYDNQSLDKVIEFIEYLLSIFEDRLPIRNPYLMIFRYFKNKTHILSDELVERIIIAFGPQEDLIPAISKAMLIKHYKDYNPKLLMENHSISIDDLVDITDSVACLLGSRFFTEEEILKYPNYFDPEKLKYRTRAYISKDTFRVLNKTWGKRQRYNDKLVNFPRIIIGCGDIRLSLDNLKYLVEKTDATNKEILSAHYSNRNHTIGADLIKIIKIYDAIKNI